jgi:hypothetical protein
MNADLLTIATSSGTASLDEVSLKFTNSGSGSANYNVSNAYLTDGISEVTISVPDRDCYFQKVLLGDMTNRWVLCSEDTGGSLDCANLPSPKVGNMEAFQVKTPSYCGPFSTSTVLDLTNTKLTYTGGSESAVYKLDGVYINSGNGDGSYLDKSTLYIWDSLGVSAKLSTNSGSGTLDVVNSLGGTGYYAATLAKLEDSNGTATLSTQSIFIEKTGGSYAALNGSGWLQLRDSQGKEVYLDPTKIVFSEDSFTATHDAYGFVAQDSGEEGRLNSNSLSLFNNSGSADLSISELTFIEGSDSANYKISGVYINSSGDGSYLDKSTLSIWDSSGATGKISVSGTFGGSFQTNTGQGKNANYSATGVEILETNGGSTSLNTTGLHVVAGGGSEGKIWAGGAYVSDGANWVNIVPPPGECSFHNVLLGDMTNRWVLCSEGTGSGSLDCANLPSPKVGNMEAFQVKTPSYCGPFSTSTVLDLTNTELTYTGGSESAVYKLNGVYIDSSGDGSYLNKSTLSIWSGSGATGSVSVGTASFGAVFRTDTGTGKNANYSAVEASISDTSGNTATLNTTGLQVHAGGGSQGKIWAGGVYVNDGGNYVNITPPGKDAYFQSMSFCVDGTTKTAMVLMTTPD